MDTLTEIVDEIANANPTSGMRPRSRQQRGAAQSSAPSRLTPLAPIKDKPKRARRQHPDAQHPAASAGDDGGHRANAIQKQRASVIADALTEIVDEIAIEIANPARGTRSRQQRGATLSTPTSPATPLAPIKDKPKRARRRRTYTHPTCASAGDDGGHELPAPQKDCASVIADPLTEIVNEIATPLPNPRVVARSRQQRGAKTATIPARLSPLAPIKDKPGGINPFDDPVIGEIIRNWLLRQQWHRAEKSLILQGKALCRSWVASDTAQVPPLPHDATVKAAKAWFKKLSAVASPIFDQALDASFAQRKIDELTALKRRIPANLAARASYKTDPRLAISIGPFIDCICGFRPLRKPLEARLEKLALIMPVSGWVAKTRGFGVGNLAGIVGEAGDIGSYKSVSALWKRMGLAVIDGGRQRKMKDKAEAKKHGYSPKRRSVAFNLADCLIKGNGDGEYRQLYLSRKEIEAAKPEVESDGHAHARAARYMTKAVLRDLYLEWRKSTP
jgi:hypothetical protein